MILVLRVALYLMPSVLSVGASRIGPPRACVGSVAIGLSCQHRNAQAERSVIELARTSTDPDERTDFIEREAGSVTIPRMRARGYGAS